MGEKYVIQTWVDDGDYYTTFDDKNGEPLFYSSVDDAKRGLDREMPNWRKSMWSKKICKVHEEMVIRRTYEDVEYIDWCVANKNDKEEWEKYNKDAPEES